MGGWAIFHRQIFEWEWYTDANTFRLFFHLVMKANHADGCWRGKNIKRGQHITSINKLSEALELSPKQIRLALEKLKSTGEIETLGTNKNTVINVVNYSVYQEDLQEKGEQKGNQRAIKGQSKGNKQQGKQEGQGKQKSFSPDSYEYRIAEYLFIKIQSRNPGHKKPNLQAWAKQVDYMIRLDHREVKEIGKVIDWCQSDSFWQTNILSTKKLRDKYDELKMKMQQPKQQQYRSNSLKAQMDSLKTWYESEEEE